MPEATVTAQSPSRNVLGWKRGLLMWGSPQWHFVVWGLNAKHKDFFHRPKATQPLGNSSLPLNGPVAFTKHFTSVVPFGPKIRPWKLAQQITTSTSWMRRLRLQLIQLFSAGHVVNEQENLGFWSQSLCFSIDSDSSLCLKWLLCVQKDLSHSLLI